MLNFEKFSLSLLEFMPINTVFLVISDVKMRFRKPVRAISWKFDSSHPILFSQNK